MIIHNMTYLISTIILNKDMYSNKTITRNSIFLEFYKISIDNIHQLRVEFLHLGTVWPCAIKEIQTKERKLLKICLNIHLRLDFHKVLLAISPRLHTINFTQHQCCPILPHTTSDFLLYYLIIFLLFIMLETI